tara:strand:+ start:4187 stop:4510 length:324 start_codon:yes stop_codon:yes gene_type:complete
MGRITKAQSYAIRWLDSENMSPENIASELNLTVKQVGSILEKNAASNGDVKTKTEKVSAAKKLMVNETGSGKSGVTIMTGEASQAIEQSKPSQSIRNPESYIYKPNQ